MKKKFLMMTVLCAVFAFSAQAAQRFGNRDGNGYRNAIGLRAGWGLQASYQRYVFPGSRVEADAGINRYGFDAAGIYQWMFNISSRTKGTFKGYAGVGAALGDWSFKDAKKEGFSFGVVGQAGMEYTFRIPMLLSLDYRPGW